jgi:ligand-binding SRPBCC domain-containing protein
MRHTFEAEQWLPYPVELVFTFFANPQNLPRLMPAWQKARIEEAMYSPPPPRPDTKIRTLAAGAGSRMTISFRPFPYSPFRIPWEAEISEFAWNDHFCDIQLRGPFAYWRHCHRLRSENRAGQAGTLLRDELEYEMHLGALGELTHSIAVRRQIRKIFDLRHQRTEELLAAACAPFIAASSR